MCICTYGLYIYMYIYNLQLMCQTTLSKVRASWSWSCDRSEGTLNGLEGMSLAFVVSLFSSCVIFDPNWDDSMTDNWLTTGPSLCRIFVARNARRTINAAYLRLSNPCSCCVLHRRVMALVIFISCAARISCLE